MLQGGQAGSEPALSAAIRVVTWNDSPSRLLYFFRNSASSFFEFLVVGLHARPPALFVPFQTFGFPGFNKQFRLSFFLNKQPYLSAGALSCLDAEKFAARLVLSASFPEVSHDFLHNLSFVSEIDPRSCLSVC